MLCDFDWDSAPSISERHLKNELSLTTRLLCAIFTQAEKENAEFDSSPLFDALSQVPEYKELWIWWEKHKQSDIKRGKKK